MKKVILILLIIIIIIVLGIFGIKNNVNNQNNNEMSESEESMNEYKSISPKQMIEEIKSMNKDEYVILDVRTKEEHEEERIPNSVLLPLDRLDTDADEVLPDKDIRIYVYCRTGRRSLAAAYKLMTLGYTNVYDIGGISGYTEDTVKGKI
jgi:rhodanese-related sulfurtransferase